MEEAVGRRKIMVVADPGRESLAALQWVLSHSILEHDDLILLHVQQCSIPSWGSTFSSFLKRPPPSPYLITTTSSSSRSSSLDQCRGNLEFLEEMKGVCEAVQPKVRVQIEKVEMDGRDKASVILLQTKVFSIDLLVIGQRRSLSSAILGPRLSGGMPTRGIRGIELAEYLIENSDCTCVGVQKKGQNGGYILNSKTHKNFWLLA